MSKKTLGISVVIATATLLSPLVVATSAEAAEKSLGNINVRRPNRTVPRDSYTVYVQR